VLGTGQVETVQISLRLSSQEIFLIWFQTGSNPSPTIIVQFTLNEDFYRKTL
jgi:hypothetical protein